MADLLECLIQVKALRETLVLAETGTAEKAPVPVWQRLAEAERRYALALEGVGPLRPKLTPSAQAPAGSLAEFVRLRRANLAMLDGYRAAQLSGLVDWPGRPSTTVADLVAIMLANDTEVLGEWRRARANPESGPTSRWNRPVRAAGAASRRVCSRASPDPEQPKR